MDVSVRYVLYEWDTSQASVVYMCMYIPYILACSTTDRRSRKGHYTALHCLNAVVGISNQKTPDTIVR
jgi:hypothetical protein